MSGRGFTPASIVDIINLNWQILKNMLITDTSVLNKTNEIKAAERVSFSIEGLINIIKMVEISYSRLLFLLDSYDGKNSEEVTMQAWLVIGNLNRLHCLIDKVSGIRKGEVWFQLFIRKITAVESLRHIIEHYDGEINGLILNIKPILGHVSWIIYEGNKKVQVKIVVPKTLRKYKGLGLVNPAGKVMRAKIDHITYYLGADSLDISNLYYDLEQFTRGLEKYIADNYC